MPANHAIVLDRPTVTFPNALIAGPHWIDALPDGTRVLIRPLRPNDREREAAFLRRLSPPARRFRFFADFKEARPALPDRPIAVDGRHRRAYVALTHDHGQLREVGVSRCDAAPGAQQCECAITVADDWAQRGLGVLLMRHLIDVTRRNGFTRMFAIGAADNLPMRELAGQLGFRRHLDPDDPAQVIDTLEL